VTSRWAFLALLAGAGGCSTEAAAPSITDIQAAQAKWASHNLVRYGYRYETNGFFNALDGQAIRLIVIQDTVRSAQFVATNDSVPTTAATLPTVDALFALAIAARQDGTLTSIEFDPTFGFPSRLVLAGPPDASGSITASGIELLP
jgi:hypothetical protein